MAKPNPVSFGKTPQARDDFYSSSTTGLTASSSDAVTLDVTAGDRGGAAARLYSLDNGDNANDLLARDGIGAANYSAHGATISITAAGAVAYDASTWGAEFQALLQGLAPGEYLQDSFTYAIQLGNGTLSWATVTLQIAGENDGPVITSGEQAGAVGEDGVLSAAGQVTATDVDNGDHQQYSLVGGGAGEFGSLSLNAGSGAWTYTLDNGAENVQALAEGETHDEVFWVRVTDDFGAFAEQAVTVTVVGTNDAATITGSATGSVTEGTASNPGVPTASGDLLSDDVDNEDDAFQAGSGQGSQGFGTYAVTAAGVWSYTLDNANAEVNGLDSGETLSDSFTVLSADGTAAIVEITINGTTDNQAPIDISLKAHQPPSETTLPGAGAVIATLSTSDPDAGDTFTYSFASGGAGFSISGSSLITTAGLALGTTHAFTLRSTDSGGAFVDQDVRIITGTNAQEGLPAASGDDILYALAGPDLLLGQSGDDTLFGQAGADFLDGGTGNDVLAGGADGDHYAFALISGMDVVRDSAGITDRLDINFANANLATLNFERRDADGDLSADDLVLDYNGQQIVVADHYSGQPVELMNFTSGTFSGYVLRPPEIERLLDTDTIGSTRSDVIASSSAGEVLVGGIGFDMLFGNGGNDTLNGDSGNDLLVGGDGNDTLNGGDGNDVLRGDAGADFMLGGLGADRFYFGRASDAQDLIGDFVKGAGGDVLDLHDLLGTFSGYNGTNAFSAGYLTFEANGLGGTTVRVDADGGGDGYVTLAIIANTLLTEADAANYLL